MSTRTKVVPVVSTLFLSLCCWEENMGGRIVACQGPGVLDRQLCVCGRQCQEKQQEEEMKSHTEGLESQGHLLNLALGNRSLKQDDPFNKHLLSAYGREDSCCKKLTARAVSSSGATGNTAERGICCGATAIVLAGDNKARGQNVWRRRQVQPLCLAGWSPTPRGGW